MKKNNLIPLALIPFLQFSCSQKTEKKETKSNYYMLERKYDDDEIATSKTCTLKNGTFDAKAYYYNKKTGFANTYILKTKVENCIITQLNFPNGDHLDKNHITSTPIDQKGKATVTTDDNKTYEVDITE